ncbi:MAG: cyclic nucleotide-binding domain-containing protein [Pseudomonadota bacterium]
MTQRYCSSVSLVLDVALHYQGEVIGHCKTRQISFNGILLTTGPVRVEKHDIVDITLTFHGVIDKCFHMKGIVTDHSANTVRLTFIRYYPEYFKIVSELLNGNADQPNNNGKEQAQKSFINPAKSACDNCAAHVPCVLARIPVGENESLVSVIKIHPHLHRGEQIFRAGEPFRSLYLIRSGTVKTWTVSEDGEEHIIRFHFPGDIIGLGGIGQGAYDCNATTLDDGSLCEIPFSKFQVLAEQYPSINYELLKLMSHEIVHSRRLMKVRGYRSASARLASFLNELSQNLSARGFASRDFNLAMRRRDIADYLGLAEETVSRTLSQFKDDGMLEVHRKYIRINDREHLRKLCGAPQNAPAGDDNLLQRRLPHY